MHITDKRLNVCISDENDDKVRVCLRKNSCKSLREVMDETALNFSAASNALARLDIHDELVTTYAGRTLLFSLKRIVSRVDITRVFEARDYIHGSGDGLNAPILYNLRQLCKILGSREFDHVLTLLEKGVHEGAYAIYAVSEDADDDVRPNTAEFVYGLKEKTK